ncbi:TPA: 50S ribosomal protein L18 [candidate division WWE3 bacterium]|uniref:Large ribosomal subunit protein uL18 n=5 Tax=Katanobacteria TaxID=422282 RepID=A0A0G1MW46_UNCKA|nr:MAG: 50S ribosomal protein L18 [candidate division WWE3 bacterium GW2011_GWA2_44_16]KKT70156.1 MAG: 50S ribosomal protein L18 [candidate division WWE3 bacterium GW2011_GWB1_44_4]KKT85012.1 MAG: 50S ribosomal protein L18 [candidate division WWE3 bacterium GW2011_GWC2_44_9]OGC52245.1 MAG: 50S ribosomal protein L18 [candidate division WWE3 bacterium RIFCSPHIGHO2_01_FULL_43_9]HAZ29303.1 50S ribosomal protein L18 [candidate division WWE3 bacterium]
MISKVVHRKNKRERRRFRIRGKVVGDSQKPRLSVFRSNRYIYGQVIDDTAGKTLVDVSALVKGTHKGVSKLAAAKKCGEELGKLTIKAGITKIGFDRGGYKYTGRVKGFADGVRSAGVKF